MRFVRKYWPGMLLAFLCLVASTAFSLVVPRVLGQGIDSVLHAGSRTYLYVAAGIIVGASVLRGLAGYGNQYLTQVISQKVSYDIRNELYDHLQKLSFAYHDRAQTGQLMSRATVDIEAVRMFLAMGLLSLISTVIMIVGVAVLMVMVDWSLGLMTIAFVPPVAWLTIYLNRRLQPIWLSVQQLIASLGTTLQESLMGIRVVKGFSREKEESRKFSADAQRLYDAQVDAARQTAINMPTMVLVMALPVALVLWYGGQQVAASDAHHRRCDPVHPVHRHAGDAHPPHRLHRRHVLARRFGGAAHPRDIRYQVPCSGEAERHRARPGQGRGRVRPRQLQL